jgi:hypothetical protein
MKQFTLLILVVFNLSSLNLQAQFTRYYDHGLGNGFAITSTNVWHACDYGLIKYDLNGNVVQVFDLNNFAFPEPITINGNQGIVADVAVDGLGNVWIAMGTVGVGRIASNGTWTLFRAGQTPGLPTTTNFDQIIGLPNGTVYVGGFGSPLYTFSAGTWSKVNEPQTSFPKVTDLILDSQNRPVYAGNSDVYRLENGTWVNLATTSNPTIQMTGLYAGTNGRVYFCDNNGGFGSVPTDPTLPTLAPTYPTFNRELWSIAVRNGKWYLGTWYSGGIFEWNGTSWKLFNQTNSAVTGDITGKMTFDAAGNLWANQYPFSSDGLLKYDGTTWKSFRYGIPDLSIGDAGDMGDVWFASQDKLAKFNVNANGYNYLTAQDQNFPPFDPITLAAGTNGNIWLGGFERSLTQAFTGTNTLLKVNGTALTRYTNTNTNNGLPPGQIYQTEADKTGRVYMAVSDINYNFGLTIFNSNNNTWETLHNATTTPNRKLPNNFIKDLQSDPTGQNVWIANGAGGLVQYRTSSQDFAIFGSPQIANFPTDIKKVAVSSNTTWFLSERGLGKITNAQASSFTEILPSANGLASTNVLDIAVDAGGNLWLTARLPGDIYQIQKLSGTTWTTYSTSNSNFIVPSTSYYSDNGNKWGITLSPEANTLFFTANIGISRIDGGSVGTNACSPDVTPPTVANCPANISLTTSNANATATWTAPTATDACPGNVTLTSNFQSGASFPIGTTTVTYTARDAANNSAICSFTVTVTQVVIGGGCTNNLLQNSGFESNLSNWEGSGAVISTVASSGTKSINICQNTSIRQTMATTAGKNLTLNFKARTESDLVPGSPVPILSYIKYLSSAYQPLVTEFFSYPASNTYTQTSFSKVAPASTAWVEIGFLGQPFGCVLVDEVCLSEGGTSNPLPDLTLANINIVNPTVANGSPFVFKYDIKNIGTVSTTNTFITQLYFSTDNMLSANDLAVYTEPAFFLVAGQTISQINSGFNVTGIPAGTYYLIMKADGNNQMTESDENNNVLASTTTFNITGGGGSNCAISNLIGTTIPCNDNGTPNIATDDTYSFNMTISGTSGCGSGWTGGIAPFTTGTYGVGYGMGPYLISGGNTVLTIRDNVNPAITTLVTVVAPPTCSANVSPKPDLELSLTAAPQSPGQWKNTVLTLTLKNTGTVAATNVAVDFINQSNVQVSNMLAYISHVAPASTNFNSWTGFWNVGTVAAGQTLVLTYTGFTKLATQIPIFSQVKTENPADADSSPGNNTTGNPTEDDEARVVINVNFLASGERQLDDINQIDLENMTDYTLFPNPAGESVSILLNEKATQSHSTTTPSTITLLNQLGKPVYQKIIDADILENRVLQMDLSDFSNGLYFVKMESLGQRTVVKRLIISRMY